jgi:hypothetical protein
MQPLFRGEPFRIARAVPEPSAQQLELVKENVKKINASKVVPVPQSK